MEAALGAPEPADFDAFWQRETAALDATTPVDPTMTKVPEKSNERWTVYKVSFASKGRRVWGWLSIPCGKGPWPVEVGVASAGCGGYSMLPQTAPDRIRLYMTVFPFEPSLDMKANTGATGSDPIRTVASVQWSIYSLSSDMRKTWLMEGMSLGGSP